MIILISETHKPLKLDFWDISIFLENHDKMKRTF